MVVADNYTIGSVKASPSGALCPALTALLHPSGTGVLSLRARCAVRRDSTCSSNRLRLRRRLLTESAPSDMRLCDGRERSTKSRQSCRLNDPGESATHHADERLPRYEDPPSEAERWDLPPSRELVSMRT